MLEDGVGDAFARVFGGSIVPQEVEALLRRAASDGVQTLPDERYLAPNEYVITLSTSDYERFTTDREFTATAFARHLDGYLQDQGWQTYGDVVVRFEQSEGLHTGQYRARAIVNPDADPRPSPAPPAQAQSTHAYSAEPGATAMTDNPTYRGGQGNQGDNYLDDQYGRPQDESRAAAPDPQRPAYPQEQGYAPGYDQGYAPRPGYDQGGYPEQGYGQGYGQGYAPGQGGYSQGYPGYEQRPPAGGYNAPAAPGYDQGYRPAPGAYPQQGQPYGPPAGGGYAPPAGDYDYGRPAPGRHEPRPEYGQQPGYGGAYGRPEYGQQDYAQPDYAQPAGQPDYAQPDYGQPAGYGGYAPHAAPSDHEYGQPAGQPAPGGYGGYPPAAGEYPSTGRAITLQLDDGSGRTYQLREGANVIGRGQEAQFRLPDTGVSRRHLEIRWDGQVALLSDLNSTNGTTVNNAPVQEWQLADGDVIRLGHSEIIVHVR